jgi:hypothetical protein
MTISEQGHARESGFVRSHLNHSFKLAKESSDALIAAHLHLYRHIGVINRRWLERLDETRDLEVALANVLLQCPDPVEANALCRDWILRRGEVLASDMQEFGKLWQEFCREVIASGQVRESPEDRGCASS